MGGIALDKVHFARNLRKESTDAEKLLWRKLRSKQFLGLKFRRQQSIGKYIVDFVCFEKKIIIEADGSQHIDNSEYDNIRSEWLFSQGFKVLRFYDNDILRNIEGVLEVIKNEIENHATPSPGPSHQGRGGIDQNQDKGYERNRFHKA